MMQGSRSWSRRRALSGLGATWIWPRLAAVGLASAALPARGAPEDHLTWVTRLRLTDLTPPWLTSGNWGNRNFDPWTDYLSGAMPDEEFERVCARETDYCLRDIWNLRKRKPAPIDWAAGAPNWNGIHALAMRFQRTGQQIYLDRWLAVVGDHARWQRASRQGKPPLSRPGELLEAAVTWGGILTALTLAAKGLGAEGTGASKRSPFEPQPAPVSAGQAARLPADFASDLAAAFATLAPDLLAAYAQPRYVPNQRLVGLECLSMAGALLPSAAMSPALLPRLDATLADALERYVQRDGGQLEQSFNYAQLVVDSLGRILKLPQREAPSWRAAAENATTGWARLTQAIAQPTGGLPQLGNVAAGRLPAPSGARFAATSMAFPYSGLYCQRSGWNADAAALFMFVRRRARGHTMAGTNALQLHAFGKPILVAGGPADYRPVTGDTRVTNAYLAETSSWKLNTVLVDGLSQAEGSTRGLVPDEKGLPDITRVPRLPIRAGWLTDDTVDYMEGWHDEGYRAADAPPSAAPLPMRHRRQVIFLRPWRAWLVVDTLQGVGPHRFSQVWKFAPRLAADAQGFGPGDVTLAAADGEIRAREARPDGVGLLLRQVATAPLRYRRFHASEGLGYVARSASADPDPAVDVHAEWDGVGDQVCLSLLLPFRGADPDVRVERDTSRDGLRMSVTFADGAAVSARVLQRAGRLPALSVSGQMVGGPPFRLDVDQEPGNGRLQVAGRLKTLIVPEGFRWTVNEDGDLRPDYGPGSV